MIYGRKRRFLIYEDPGHAWLSVDYDTLRTIGLRPQDFSRYSYRQNSRMLLEEDCDLPRFIKGYEKRWGVRPDIRTKTISDRREIGI